MKYKKPAFLLLGVFTATASLAADPTQYFCPDTITVNVLGTNYQTLTAQILVTATTAPPAPLGPTLPIAGFQNPITVSYNHETELPENGIGTYYFIHATTVSAPDGNDSTCTYALTDDIMSPWAQPYISVPVNTNEYKNASNQRPWAEVGVTNFYVCFQALHPSTSLCPFISSGS